MAYKSTHTGQQIDAGVDAALNPDTTPTEGSNALMTSGGVKSALDTFVRPNLLDNWYFVGGGGAGAFPINQRGQSSYNAAGYTIDRWKSLTGGTVEISASGVNFAKTLSAYTYNQNLQYVPLDDSWVGKTFTLSALTSDGMVTGSGVLSTSAYVYADGLSSGNFRFIYDNTNKWVRVEITSAATGIVFYAVKLELGNTQTLAHQENGVWVLNEIPDYGEQLRKCQRYLRQSFVSSPTEQGWCACVAGSVNSFPAVNWPTPMASMPDVITYGGDGTPGAVTDWATDANITGVGESYASANGFGVSKSLAFTTGKLYYFHYRASAEL